MCSEITSSGVPAPVNYPSVTIPPVLPDLFSASLSRPPANGRWSGLFAWDEGCGGKHAGKIEADGGCRGTGRVACPVEIGAPRRSGPGAGDPADAGGAAGGGDRGGVLGGFQLGRPHAGGF